MKSFPDLSKTIPVDLLKGETPEETIELRKMSQDARNYITGFGWCKKIKESFYGFGIGGVFGVFLFNIEPSAEAVDEWVWVIVGDLPPAYIAAIDAPNPACALDAYIGAMEEWIEDARRGGPVDDLIPVNVPATLENALMLKSRLEFLDEKVLSQYTEDIESGQT